ncbi:MAG: hypothetical protein E7773_11145 [Sphingomonas sp.]|uniref:hypothetical protein n=1 Tax=Sphingomonas sp. TaxID=28214 RepID=UPI00121C236C|nr:hypothetical protein [Sphingomonas sp.]THD35016.1 MAG: hypothetical protein E7773_11145 [Sphingomonas sp.]
MTGSLKRHYSIRFVRADDAAPIWKEINRLRETQTIYRGVSMWHDLHYRVSFSDESAALAFFMTWCDDIEIVDRWAHDEWGNRLRDGDAVEGGAA